MSKINRNWVMPVLIEYVDGEWRGYELLMKVLERLTSICSIPKYQLYKKTLKEYHNYRSIYDMDHNAPSLLMCRALNLAKSCTMLTVPHTDSDINTVMIDISVPAWHNSRYPMLPHVMVDHIGKLFDMSTPYMDRSLMVNYDGLSEVKEILLKNFKIGFYSNWQSNLKDSKPWIITCINQIMLLVPDNNKLACSRVIESTAEEIAKSPISVFNTTSIQPGLLLKLWYSLGFR